MAQPLHSLKQTFEALIDKMTEGICKADESAASESELQARKDMVRAFLIKNQQRLYDWVAEHPRERPPVYYIEKTREVIWLSRKQRRKVGLDRRHKIRSMWRRELGLSGQSKTSRSEPSQSPSKSEATQAKPPKADGDEVAVDPFIDADRELRGTGGGDRPGGSEEGQL